MNASLVTRAVGPDDVPDLASLFESSRNTRRCFCTALCSTRTSFAWGWLTGGNQERFEAIGRRESAPMGVLAFEADQPVGWVACGPRSRYARAEAGRSQMLRHTDRVEDDSVWLVACYFIDAAHRSQGVAHALLSAAIQLAREEGAIAVEGWPLSTGHHVSADSHLGREELYDSFGFTCVARPTPERSIMRLELNLTR